MKYLGLILMVALVASQVLAARINENDDALQHSRVQRGMNDQFRKFLEEKVRKVLREGNKTMGIPIMDPYVKDIIDIVLEEDNVKGTAQLKNLEVTGVSDYKVDKAEVAVLFSKKITIGLTWPQITAKGFYKLAIVAAEEFKIFGTGELKLTLTNLSYETVAYLSVASGVKVEKMETKISLGSLELVATGLFGDEDMSRFVSAIISDAAPQLVVDYQRELTTRANKIVSETVNKKLEGMSLMDIIAIIS